MAAAVWGLGSVSLHPRVHCRIKHRHATGVTPESDPCHPHSLSVVKANHVPTFNFKGAGCSILLLLSGCEENLGNLWKQYYFSHFTDEVTIREIVPKVIQFICLVTM